MRLPYMETKNYHIRQKGKQVICNYFELLQVFFGIPFAIPSYISTTHNTRSTSSDFPLIEFSRKSKREKAHELV